MCADTSSAVPRSSFTQLVSRPLHVVNESGGGGVRDANYVEPKRATSDHTRERRPSCWLVKVCLARLPDGRIDMSDNYIELLKLVLTGAVFPESSDQHLRPSAVSSPKAAIRNLIINAAAKKDIRLVKRHRYDAIAREEGRDWPSIAYTMVGMKRLNNVQHAIETILAQNVPGDIVECGVWRGGCAMFMRAVLDAHNISDRTIWAADSFEGLPKPNTVKYPADHGWDLSEVDYLSVPLEAVRNNFDRFGLLDQQVQFLKGWFKDTLPTAPIDKIAVLRADGDLYESTMDVLKNLYDKVSPGGFVIIDDYYSWEPCNRAVTEFRARRDITAPIETVDWTGVYWRIPKTEATGFSKSA